MGMQAFKSAIWSKIGTLTMVKGISLCALVIGV